MIKKREFIKISDLTTTLETEAKEEAYSKGFADGVRLVIACYQKR